MILQSIEQTMTLPRLPDINWSARFIVENIDTNLLAKVDNLSTTAALKNTLITASAPEHRIPTSH